MGMIRAEMTRSADIGFSCLVQRESVRGVATVASVLDAVAAFTEGGPDFLRNGKIFALNSHSFKSDGMAALCKLGQLFLVTLTTLFGEDHGLLL